MTPGNELPPDPAALIESMRAFGYSLPTAIADLIDNSITAGARTIDVAFRWAGSASTISVSDDGHGMTEETLVEAMRLGSRSPTEARAPHDLGRFGLGLKSAAWSQARSLTVMSRTDTSVASCRRWDLDHVTDRRRWEVLDEPTTGGQSLFVGLADGSGTVVLLERLDRLVGASPMEDDAAERRFYASAESTTRHLAMVFHRFMTSRAQVRIAVDARPVLPWDPFLSDHPATQRLQSESLSVGSHRVRLQPYVLPHFSKLEAETHSRAAGVKGWNAHQGFYVYRANRLLVSGDWLGLRNMQQEEHYKLARISVDVDNAADELWQIDVRKATARIPGPLRPEFQRVARITRQKAANAYRFRGKLVAMSSERSSRLSFVWQAKTLRDAARIFRINRQHPALVALLQDPDTAGAVEQALRLVEENLPTAAIVMESREHPDAARSRPYESDPAEVRELLERAHAVMCGRGLAPLDALRALATVEPFDSHPEIVQTFTEGLGLAGE